MFYLNSFVRSLWICVNFIFIKISTYTIKIYFIVYSNIIVLYSIPPNPMFPKCLLPRRKLKKALNLCLPALPFYYKYKTYERAKFCKIQYYACRHINLKFFIAFFRTTCFKMGVRIKQFAWISFNNFYCLDIFYFKKQKTTY